MSNNYGLGVRNQFMDGPVMEKPFWSPVELFIQDGKFVMPEIHSLVNLESRWFWICIGSILFNPLYWNTVARNEFHNKTMTKMFGSPLRGTYVLAVIIFSLGIIRDLIFKQALAEQPESVTLGEPVAQYIGIAFFVVGQIFVLTSIYALGITGTYLGDYFGILMKERVTGFPFNVMENPMYNGSTMCFIGTSIWYKKPAGLIISAIVFVVYQIALAYEGPFTDKIYSGAAKKATGPVEASSSKQSTSPVAGLPVTPKRPTASSRSSGSYAGAVEEPRSKNGLESVNPKPVKAPFPTHVLDSAESPMRVTRSRSKARLVEDD